MELIFGLAGMILLLGSYILLITNRIGPESRIYLRLNIIASGILLIYAYLLASIPFIIINTFWIAVTLIKLIDVLRKNEKEMSGK
jgi:hypothetical protein